MGYEVKKQNTQEQKRAVVRTGDEKLTRKNKAIVSVENRTKYCHER